MLKKELLVVAGICAVFAFAACKKKKEEEDTTKTANANKGKMVCVVDGKEWISDGPTKKHTVPYHDSILDFDQSVYGNEGLIFGDTLTLSAARVMGTDSNALVFDIVLTENRIGPYSIVTFPTASAGKANAYFYTKMGRVGRQNGYKQYNTTGTINISSFSDSLRTCSGTFNFEMVSKNPADSKIQPHVVTKGAFTDVKFD
ncbi:MAG: hypothetical protein IT244_09305 [Bacteroidia bacterium]|nr:hypothetical protein [Bacteroidia bacterium]